MKLSPISFRSILSSPAFSPFEPAVIPLDLRDKYFFEKEHPFHPKPGSYTPFWKLWMKNSEGLSFEQYLSKNNFSYSERIVYFSDAELAGYECIPKVERGGGCQLIQNGYNLTDGTYLFILTLEKKLYLLQEEVFVKDGVTYYKKHSTLSRGEPLLSVGEITILDGNIQEVSMHSGHYHPNEKEKEQFQLFLTEFNVNIDKIYWPAIPEKYLLT